MLPSFRFSRRATLALGVSLFAFAAIACGGGRDQGNGTPTSTATPSAGDQSPTAEATVPPTPTGTPQRGTPTAAPGATPTRTPGASTPALTPTPPVEASPTSTPIPFETGGVVLNVTEGTLQLRPGAGSAIEFKSGVDVADFRATVTFSNPFHPDAFPWNYGLKFRERNGAYQMLVFDHRGRLNYLTGNSQTVDLVSTTDLTNFRTSGGQSNKLTLLVLEENVWIYVNGNLELTMTVAGVDVSGDLALVTDIYNQTTVQNASVAFTSFSINRAGLAGMHAAGTLRKASNDEIAVGEASLATSAGYTRVTLVSPIAAFSGDYSYGLRFRSASGVENWLVFDDLKSWQHIRRTTDGEEEVLAQGVAATLRTGQSEANRLEVLSIEGQHRVYVNGALLTNLTFALGDLPATIAPFAGFLPTHQPSGLATEYRDFVVWSILS